VYFFADPQHALQFAASYQSNQAPGNERGNVAIIEFEVPDELDPLVQTDDIANSDFEIDTAYRLEHDIPPENIRAIHYFRSYARFPDPFNVPEEAKVEWVATETAPTGPRWTADDGFVVPVDRALRRVRRGFVPAFLIQAESITRSEFLRLLAGEALVIGPLRRIVTLSDGPFAIRGGEGSGHHGHAGRPGERGGSLPGAGGPQPGSGSFGDYLKVNQSDTAFPGGPFGPDSLPEAVEAARLPAGNDAWRNRREEWAKELSTLGEATIRNGAWIGPGGKPLGPDADHQATAMALLRWDLHNLNPRATSVATDMVVQGGMVRYNVDVYNVYLDIPSVKDTTDGQWATMAAIVTNIAREDKVVPEVVLAVGGAFAPTTYYDGRDAYDQLGLDEQELAREFDAWLSPPYRSTETVHRGGPGSGHRGHEGRPGERGGSLPGAGGPSGDMRGISASMLNNPVVDDLPRIRDRLESTLRERGANHIRAVYARGESPSLNSLGIGDYWILGDGTVVEVDSHDLSVQSALEQPDVVTDAFKEFLGSEPQETGWMGRLSPEGLALGLGLVRWSTTGQRGISVGDAKMTDEQAGRISEMAGNTGTLHSIMWEAWEPTLWALPNSVSGNFDLNHDAHGNGVEYLLRIRSLVHRGGPGSGHFAHEGRPGQRGGSLPGAGGGGKAEREATRIRAGAVARRYRARALAREPQTTSFVTNMATSHGGGLHQLEFRVKSDESLARKIEQNARDMGISVEEAADDINDVLRYTMTFPREDFVGNVLAVQDDLARAGWEPWDASYKNYFAPGDAYDGYNTVVVNRESGQRFELQFHTPETATMRASAHILYDRYRESTDRTERVRLWNEMSGLWRDEDRPANWERLPGLLMTDEAGR
jgi:hypothetical protein